MPAKIEGKPKDPQVARTTPTPTAPKENVYTYETAGITEREWHLPIWLWDVAGALVIWGLYYLITYWTDPSLH